MTQYTFQIQGKVKAKQSTKFARVGEFIKTYTPSDIKEYSNWVKICFKEAYPNHIPFSGACMVKIEVFFTIPKSYSKKKVLAIEEGYIFPTVKPDCDNITKNIADSLNGIAWVDDKQIVGLEVRKKYSDHDYVEVNIWEI